MNKDCDTPMTPEALAALAREDVRRALQEDVGAGDLTAALVPAQRRARARILAREEAVICGAPWVEATLRALDGEDEPDDDVIDDDMILG